MELWALPGYYGSQKGRKLHCGERAALGHHLRASVMRSLPPVRRAGQVHECRGRGIDRLDIERGFKKPVKQVFKDHSMPRPAWKLKTRCQSDRDWNDLRSGNHTVLIRKDGTEVSIDDSGAPSRIGWEDSGVVLVFRDITERNRRRRNCSLRTRGCAPCLTIDRWNRYRYSNTEGAIWRQTTTS